MKANGFDITRWASSFHWIYFPRQVPRADHRRWWVHRGIGGICPLPRAMWMPLLLATILLRTPISPNAWLWGLP